MSEYKKREFYLTCPCDYFILKEYKGGKGMNLEDYFPIWDKLTKEQRREYEEKVAQQRKELENYTTHGITPPHGFMYPENVPQPIGKYVVSVKRNAGQNNEVVQKLFTGDSENKSILDQMREQNLLGKVLCSVKSVRCKGFNRYVFV